MSNGQTTGAALGEALANSTNTLLSFFLRKRQLDLQERGLEQKTINDTQRIALGGLNLLADFAEPGTTVNDNPFLHGLAGDLLGPDGLEAFKSAMIPPRGGGSQGSIVEALRVAYVGTLSQEQQLALGESATAKEAGKDAVTLAGISGEQAVDRTESVFIGAYASSLSNPNLSGQTALNRVNIGRQAFGENPLVTVQFPDGSVADITEASGNLNARFMQIRQTRDLFNVSDFNTLGKSIALTVREAGLEIDDIDARRIAKAKLEGKLGELLVSAPQLEQAIRVTANASIAQLGNAKLLLNQMGPRGVLVNTQLDLLREAFDNQTITDVEFIEQQDALFKKADELSRLNGFGRIMPTIETETIALPLGIRVPIGNPQFKPVDPTGLQPNEIDAAVSLFLDGRMSADDLRSFNIPEDVIVQAEARKGIADAARVTPIETLFESPTDTVVE